MLKAANYTCGLVWEIVGLRGIAAAEDEAGVRDFIARWNTA